MKLAITLEAITLTPNSLRKNLMATTRSLINAVLRSVPEVSQSPSLPPSCHTAITWTNVGERWYNGIMRCCLLCSYAFLFFIALFNNPKLLFFFSGGITNIAYTFGGKYKGSGPRTRWENYCKTSTLGKFNYRPQRVNAKMFRHVSTKKCTQTYRSINEGFEEEE